MLISALVVLLGIGAASGFLVAEAAGGDDPYDRTCQFQVSAVLDGTEYTGTAVSVYTPESDGFRTYQFTLGLPGAPVDGMRFGIVFGTDDLPDPDLFEFVGADEVGRTTTWTASYSGFSFEYTVGDMCTIERVVLVSDTGRIVLEGEA